MTGTCATIGCHRPAGTRVIRWADHPNYQDEPVCESCAAYYMAAGSTDYTVEEVIGTAGRSAV